MLKLIMGQKGTGKTKLLLEMVNTSAVTDEGDVVCIEKGKKLQFDIKHNVRLIDISEYEVKDFNSLYGFICGILASDYDITSIYIDSVLKICLGDLSEFEAFLTKLNNLFENEGKSIVITASGDYQEVPESLKKFLVA